MAHKVLCYTTGHYEPFETLTKRVERVMLESSVIGTTKLGVKNVSIHEMFLLTLNAF